MTYTPITSIDQILGAYRIAVAQEWMSDLRAELTEHDRQVAEAAWDEGVAAVYGDFYDAERYSISEHVGALNPYRTPQPDAYGATL